MHPALFPCLAVVDAELMLSVPPLFTAFQGFDTLFHSVEGFIAASANLASDMNAREAIRNITEYLPRAVKDGSDLEARTRVAFANTLSGAVMTLTGRLLGEALKDEEGVANMKNLGQNIAWLLNHLK